MRAAVRGLLVVAVLTVVLAACDAAAGPTPPASIATAAPSVSSGTGGGAATATATPAPPASASAPAPTRAEALRIDPALLALLPDDVEGHPVERSAEVEAADAADPTIPGEVQALSAAFVHDDDLSNWAVVTVVALRPGVLSDEFYRSWRESFDAGACQPAGGVTGTASATIAEREVDIGRCVEGVNTYHVRLPGDRLVSITAAGERRFGEHVVAGLRP